MPAYSSNDPHFAIVPRSLVYAAKDVLLLLVVLGLMMVAFAAILGALFGAKLGNFATFEDALIQVLLMTLGEWGDPYHDIYDVAEYPKMWTLLFVLYNVVVVLVTMNIFLSIVLDAYAAVKEYQHLEEEQRKNEPQADNKSMGELMATLKAWRQERAAAN